MGSQASTPTYPCGTSSVPSSLNRTRQTPSRPGLTRHRCPHAKHCTAPPSLRSISASAAGTLYSCSISLRELRRALSCKTSRGMGYSEDILRALPTIGAGMTTDRGYFEQETREKAELMSLRCLRYL